MYLLDVCSGKRTVRPGTVLPESRIASTDDVFLQFEGLCTEEASPSGTLMKVKLCQETDRESLTTKAKEKARR